MAAPFGPPPSLATTWILPSGVTRDSVRRSISTRMTDPSRMATGPSGKRSPDAICLMAGVCVAIRRRPALSGEAGIGAPEPVPIAHRRAASQATAEEARGVVVAREGQVGDHHRL